MSAENTIRGFLETAGIEVNGNKPYDIQIHDPSLYKRVLRQGSIGLGEGYMEGQRDCNNIDQMISRLLSANLDEDLKNSSFIQKSRFALSVVMAKLFNPQSRTGSKQVIDGHYELPVELYTSFLDPYNQYTCGYFKDTDNLEEAQEAKLHLIASKLGLEQDKDNSNIHLLDIGCGRGGLSKFMAEKYGCKVTGITITNAQVAYAKTYCKDLPVEILNLDYRDLSTRFPAGTFDKVTTVGMLEHVGPKNYRSIMEQINTVMKDDGVFLLHTIGSDISHNKTDPFIDKYIFPNGVTPSQQQLARAAEGMLTLQDFQNIGPHYDPTLMAWHKNFIKNRDSIKHISLPNGGIFDESFKRMREYYLLSCAGGSRSGNFHLFHNVYTKGYVPSSYESLVGTTYTTSEKITKDLGMI